ncbi:cell division protein FtsZ [Roseobacter cerasinus]|uniref:Cell division protein FtsZ n=1 Tax=Roseobacter cerasinus TaxID=2602289 RepID=A0A640VKG8_9RHOB|nr:DUF4177 domain-containing protein [Roseobacter cerasinus]GFE48579.1 cell division protein FtsZ [Roseobacter cerasinus]
MAKYQYRVIPAPNRGIKAKGLKTPEARFAHTVEGLMNEMAADGWEYQRAEALPSVERSGLTSTTTTWRNLLVFRKPVSDEPSDSFMPDATTLRAEPQLTTSDPASKDAATRPSEVPDGAKTPPAPEELSDTPKNEKSES